MMINAGEVAILITLLVSTISVAFGYGILTNKVSRNCKEIEDIKKRYDIIDNKLDDLHILVRKIETILNNRA